MSTGLARAALRAHRPAFIGTAVAALFAATVVSAATMMLTTINSDSVPATARTRLDDSGVGSMAAVMLIGSVYLSVFVIASTMGTAVAQQLRELAMVRAIGAAPRQIRRAVVRQALTAALPTALAGFALGGLLARLWFDAMVSHGLVPATVAFRLSWLALPVCLAVAVLTSALAAVLASLRFSMLRPARALDEATAGRRGLGFVRAPLGVLALLGACALSALLSQQPADEAGQGAFLVLILFCIGFGLLGPRLIGPAARLVSALFGRCGPSARLAVSNVRSQPRRFAAAIVPLLLVVGFGLTKIGMHTTIEHRTGTSGSQGEVWLDYVGTSLYAGFAAIAAANTLAMISFERRRDIALLRIVGTQRAQASILALWEAAVVTLTALLLGGIIALATLAPVLNTAVNSPVPYIPWPVLTAIAAFTLLLTAASTGAPVRAVLRHRAVSVLKAG